MNALIKLTVGSKTYLPGDKITEKIPDVQKRFLLREGYVEETVDVAGEGLAGAAVSDTKRSRKKTTPEK